MAQPPNKTQSKSPKAKIVLKNSRITSKSTSAYQELHVTSNYSPTKQPEITVEYPISQTVTQPNGGGIKHFQAIPKYQKVASYTCTLSPTREKGSGSDSLSKNEMTSCTTSTAKISERPHISRNTTSASEVKKSPKPSKFLMQTHSR